MTLSLYSPIEVIYLKSIGLPLIIISALNLTVPLICGLMEFPTGIIGDYIGRKKTLLLCQISFVLSMSVILFFKSIPLLFLAYILEGIGWSFYSGNTEAIVVEDTKKHKLDTNYFIAFFYTGMSIGSVLSGFFNTVTLYFGDVTNLRLILIISTFTRLIALTLSIKLKIHTPTTDKNTSSSVVKNTPLSIMKESWRVISNDYSSLSIVIYETFSRLQFFLPVIIQPLLLHKGINIFYFGVIFSFTQLIVLFIQKRCHRLVELIGEKRLLYSCSLMSALGILLLLFKPVFLTILGLILIMSVGPIKNQSLALIKNAKVDDHIRASYLSIISLLVLLINTLYLTFIGSLLEKYFTISILLIFILVITTGTFTVRSIISKPVVTDHSSKTLS